MFQATEVVARPGFGLFTMEDRENYKENRFILVKSLFGPDEVAKLKSIAKGDISPDEVLVKGDQSGNLTKLRMWDRPGEDIYNMFSRNERIVDNAEILLGEPIYVYSAKMILKNAREGGAWEWHQDYGYWYNYGCLLPDMLSCTVAVDRATKENGCLQVLRKSQKAGRINHERINDQTVVDEERLQECIKRFELEYIEMEPGDALFFDGNILHRSDSNNSDFDRWSFITSYNTVSNKPYKRVRDYGNFEPLLKLPKHAILDFGVPA